MSFTTRLTPFAALGLLALANTAPAQVAQSERELLVAVWAGEAQLLVEDTYVVATSPEGPIKGTLDETGHFLLPGAGTPTDYGLKATVEVRHPLFGTELVDLSFRSTDTLVVDLMFDADGRLTAYGDDIITFPQPDTTAFAGVSNDVCAGAVGVGIGSATLGSTLGQGIDDDVEACGTAITAPGVWYSVVGDGTTLSANTCSGSTDFDTKISVFCGDCEDLNCLAGNDDFCGLQSQVSWCSQPGVTYYILVHGFGDNAGLFELNVASDNVDCDDAVQCAAFGACCIDGGCSILTENNCNEAGGDYQGDFTECSVPGGKRTFSSGFVGADIPDFDPAGLENSIMVPLRYRLGDVNVELFVDHTWTGDLQAIVLHDGVEVMAVDRIGFPATLFGCPEDNWNGIELDDEGSGGNIEEQCPLGGNLSSPPAYTPANPLSAFDGLNAAGTWTLRLVDNAEFDTGSLIGWRITLTAATDETICDDI